MKNRNGKKALIAVVLAAALAVPAMTLVARPGKGGNGYGCPGSNVAFYDHQPFRHLDNMQYRLGLTDSQVEKIFNIDQEYRVKIFKNRKSFDAVQKLRDEKHKEIEKVLTDEQKKKFNDWRALRDKGWKDNRGPWRCPGGNI